MEPWLSPLDNAGLLASFDQSGSLAGIAGGGRWRGDWAAATLYAIADYFRDPASKSIYACLEQHIRLDCDRPGGPIRCVWQSTLPRLKTSASLLSRRPQQPMEATCLQRKSSDAAQSTVDATNNGRPRDAGNRSGRRAGSKPRQLLVRGGCSERHRDPGLVRRPLSWRQGVGPNK